MKNTSKYIGGFASRKASALVLVVMVMLICTIFGMSLLSMVGGARLNAIKIKNQIKAMLTAEAGYEKAIFWMSQQQSVLDKLKTDDNYSDSITFSGGGCDYTISFYSFVGLKPVYKVTSVGHCGQESRTVETLVAQQSGGWEMGQCRVPVSPTSTTAVYFVNKEIIDMPILINCYGTQYDNSKDIYISGNPDFDRAVSMAEARYSSSGSDKYNSVMDCFNGGIHFLQPNSQITDEITIAKKIELFKEGTDPQFCFSPTSDSRVPTNLPAVQLEFFVQNGLGKVRITNNCTVRGYQRPSNKGTLDYKLTSDSGGSLYERYDIYAYHYVPAPILPPIVKPPVKPIASPFDDTSKISIPDIVSFSESRTIYEKEDSYVKQEIGNYESEEACQIYVNGNVVIGGNLTIGNGDQIIKGKITVAATGNIWIADNILLDGPHDATDNNVPSPDNPNALALIAQGVVKVIDPGMTEYSFVDESNYESDNMPKVYSGLAYEPVGNAESGCSNDSDHRVLTDPLIVEAAITVGGGGWGAENVRWHGFGGRKEYDGKQDDLIVRGAISEAIRGAVGITNSDGFIKKYFVDERMYQGILPGDICLKRKYVPAPAGWSDFRTPDEEYTSPAEDTPVKEIEPVKKVPVRPIASPFF